MSLVKKVTKNPSEGTLQETVMTYSALQLQYYPEGAGEYLVINDVLAGIRMWKFTDTSRKPCGLSQLGCSVLYKAKTFVINKVYIFHCMICRLSCEVFVYLRVCYKRVVF
jgi:hypothetical protein